MSRRYDVAPAVLQSAQISPAHVDVRRPEAGTWVRLGPREAALLFGLSGSSADELCDRFRDRFPPDELVAALHRFESLGLLADSAIEAEERRAASDPASPTASAGAAAVIVVPAGLIACAIATLPLAAARISWPGLLSGRPSTLGIVGLMLMAALVHEAGHAVAATLLGRGHVHCRLRLGWLMMVPVLRLQLSGFWGLPRARRVLVTGAGCISHAVLAAASIDAWAAWLAMTGGGPLIFPWFAGVNVLLAVINALPLYPLDGYWLLGAVLDRPWLWREHRGYRMASSVGLAVLAALGIGGLGVRLLGGR